MVIDPIGDFIIQLKNAAAVRKEVAVVPYSKLKHAVADKLQERGYVKSVVKRGKKVRKELEVELSYGEDGKSILQDVRRVSKPGRRVYTPVSDIHSVRNGTGVRIMSTPKGILTGEEARKQNVGGEALFEIW